MRHLAEHAFCNIVVAAPVGGTLGIGELIHVVSASFGSKPAGLVIHLRRAIDPVAAAAVKLDLRDCKFGQRQGDQRRVGAALKVCLNAGHCCVKPGGAQSAG